MNPSFCSSFFVSLAMTLVPPILSLDNGLARTPPMGYRSWNQMNVNVSFVGFTDVMDVFSSPLGDLFEKAGLPFPKELDAKSTLADLGYTDVAMDDGYQPKYSNETDAPGINGGFHTAEGEMLFNTDIFPDGVAPLGDYALERGLTFSMYTNNCGDGTMPPENGYTDPQEIETHYWGDINFGVDWNVRGYKVDGCAQFLDMQKYVDYANMTGVPMLIECCQSIFCDPNGPNSSHPGCPYFVDDDESKDLVCPFHYWRTSADMAFAFDSVLGNINSVQKWMNISRPGCWAHPDMMEIGNLWTFEEDRSNFALNAIASAPLILSFNMTNQAQMARSLPVFTNTEVIAINQAWTSLDDPRPRGLVHSEVAEVDDTNYIIAVDCDDIDGKYEDSKWALQPIENNTSFYQVVSDLTNECVDLNTCQPLRTSKCDPHALSQQLQYDPLTGHLGRDHPMQDGNDFGYINIGGKTGPLVQFTHSYGPDQPNEEFLFDDETRRWSSRCSDGSDDAHDICEKRCMVTITRDEEKYPDAESTLHVVNNSEGTVRDVTYQVWAKPLPNDEVAVVVVNRKVAEGVKLTLDLASLGVTRAVRARDVLNKVDFGGTYDGFFEMPDVVMPHDSVMIKFF